MKRGLILAALGGFAVSIAAFSIWLAHEVGFADGRRAELASLIRKPSSLDKAVSNERLPGSVGFLVHDSWGLERAMGMAELGGDTINMEAGRYETHLNLFGEPLDYPPCSGIIVSDGRAKIIYGMKLTPTPQVAP